jgi:hypothetical protein
MGPPIRRSDWTGAELRSRITLLGLSLRQLAELEGWDLRTLRREAAGDTAVAERTETAVRMLEGQAADLLDQMIEDTDQAGRPIRIPHWSVRDPWPGSWWHAIAGRFLEARPDAEVVYDGDQ